MIKIKIIENQVRNYEFLYYALLKIIFYTFVTHQ